MNTTTIESMFLDHIIDQDTSTSINMHFEHYNDACKALDSYIGSHSDTKIRVGGSNYNGVTGTNYFGTFIVEIAKVTLYIFFKECR